MKKLVKESLYESESDLKGKKCKSCKKGKYKETSQLDDLNGVLHCDSCGEEVNRYINEKWDWGLSSDDLKPMGKSNIIKKRSIDDKSKFLGWAARVDFLIYNMIEEDERLMDKYVEDERFDNPSEKYRGEYEEMYKYGFSPEEAAENLLVIITNLD